MNKQFLYIFLNAFKIRLRNGDTFDEIVSSYPNISSEMISVIKTKLQETGDLSNDNN